MFDFFAAVNVVTSTISAVFHTIIMTSFEHVWARSRLKRSCHITQYECAFIGRRLWKKDRRIGYVRPVFEQNIVFGHFTLNCDWIKSTSWYGFYWLVLNYVISKFGYVVLLLILCVTFDWLWHTSYAYTVINWTRNTTFGYDSDTKKLIRFGYNKDTNAAGGPHSHNRVPKQRIQLSSTI